MGKRAKLVSELMIFTFFGAARACSADLSGRSKMQNIRHLIGSPRGLALALRIPPLDSEHLRVLDMDRKGHVLRRNAGRFRAMFLSFAPLKIFFFFSWGETRRVSPSALAVNRLRIDSWSVAVGRNGLSFAQGVGQNSPQVGRYSSDTST